MSVQASTDSAADVPRDWVVAEQPGQELPS
jgi:hypothetical protein